MQTVETTRALGEVDRELIVGALKSLFALRVAGDVDGLLRLFAADVVCFPKTTWGFASYPREIIGKDAIREAFRQRHINYVITQSIVHRTLIDGDQAAVHRSIALRERGGGLTHAFDCVDFIRFRDGLIVEISELPDGRAYDAAVNYPH